jgi:hypothetical protein
LKSLERHCHNNPQSTLKSNWMVLVLAQRRRKRMT